MLLALQSLIGVAAIPMLAWALSENRGALAGGLGVRTVAAGLALQIALVALLLLMPWSRALFDTIGAGVLALQRATDTGAQLVFGYLAGGPGPFAAEQPQFAFILAFRVLPMILVLSALVRLLYYWGVLQRVVAAFAAVLQRTFSTGGPLGTVAASSIFLGTIEAPLLIRPYLAGLGRGALFAVMTCTMATVAGTVMAIYASILAQVVPGAAGHLVAASLINVPAALMISRLMVPDGFAGDETAPSQAAADTTRESDAPTSSMDAITRGTTEGIALVAAVAAMLIVVVSLVALANEILGAITAPFGGTLTLQGMLGYLCAPLAFIIGIPASEAVAAGGLLGQKVVLNEFLAYLDLVRTPADALSPRSRLLLTYALCGFANLGSLGILIGGLSAMVPARRSEIVALAPRAVLAGFLATLLSAALVGTTVWS